MIALHRFKQAQDAPSDGFATALDEVRSGRKRGHWIWYVFPQIKGLGTSNASIAFAIDDTLEAMAFLRDPDLCSRYVAITAAVAEQLRAGALLGSLMGSDIDAKKLVSSLTLFAGAARRIGQTDHNAPCASLVVVADEVLAVATRQGYPPCAYTLRRLRQNT